MRHSHSLLLSHRVSLHTWNLASSAIFLSRSLFWLAKIQELLACLANKIIIIVGIEIEGCECVFAAAHAITTTPELIRVVEGWPKRATTATTNRASEQINKRHAQPPVVQREQKSDRCCCLTESLAGSLARNHSTAFAGVDSRLLCSG